MMEELTTLSLDTKTGELLINGIKQENVTYLQLTFNDGKWDLSTQQRRLYGSDEKDASKK